MTGKHKFTRRILATVLCAVLVLSSGGTGLGSFLTGELWESLVPTAQAATTIEVSNYDQLNSAIATANSNGVQTIIKLTGSWSGSSVSALTAISGNVILDLNGQSIRYDYYGSGDKTSNSSYQLPTNNSGADVLNNNNPTALFTVNASATLQIINSSSTAGTMWIKTRFHLDSAGTSARTTKTAAYLLNCSGTLILGDSTDASKNNFTLKTVSQATNGGSSSGITKIHSYAVAMTVSLRSSTAVLKMYGGSILAEANARSNYHGQPVAYCYPLNIENCKSVDIYGGTISVTDTEGIQTGIRNQNNIHHSDDGGTSYFAAIRTKSSNVYIFDVTSSVYAYTGSQTKGATLNAANIYSDSSSAPYVMGGNFTNTSTGSGDDSATCNAHFVRGNYFMPYKTGTATDKGPFEPLANTAAGTHSFTSVLYMADSETNGSTANNGNPVYWYGDFATIADWVADGFDDSYRPYIITTGATYDVSKKKHDAFDEPINLLFYYTRTAYTHTGWVTKEAGTDAVVKNDNYVVSEASLSDGHGTILVHPAWTPTEYEVAYRWETGDNITITDENGATYNSAPLIKNYNIENPIDRTLLLPVRPGYDFKGWRPAENVGNWKTDTLYADGTDVKGMWGDVTLTPEWTATPYTITFTTDKDGTVLENSATLLHPVDMTPVSADDYKYFNIEGGTLPSVSKPGYSFQNSWKVKKLENGGGTYIGRDLNVGDFVGIYGNLTLQANLTALKYEVSFSVPEGATLSGANKKQVTFDSELGALPTAELDGYTFLGWSTKPGTQEVNLAQPDVNAETLYTTVGNSTLYACWSAKQYKVNLFYYNSENGKTPLYGGTVVDVDFNTPYGELLNTYKPGDNVRPGWKFNQWLDANGNVVTAETIYRYAYNTELIADLVEAEYTLTFDENGGSAVADIVNYKVSDTFNLPESVKTGYSLRWKALDDAGTWKKGSLYAPGEYTEQYGTLTFIAEWSLVPYTITLDTKGGNLVNKTINYNYDSAMDAAAFAEGYTPTRAGYKFEGWFVKESIGSWTKDAKIESFDTKNHGNVTLEARWTPIEYTLTFDLNGGTYNGETTYSIPYDIEDEIPMFAPEKTAHTFVQWVVEDGFNIGEVWFAGSWIQKDEVLTGKYGNVTVRAQWDPIFYTISFNADGGTQEWNYTSYNTTQGYTLPNSVKAGYIFNGWMPDAASGTWTTDSAYPAGTAVAGHHGNVSFTAKWTAEDFTATLDANGGTLEQTTVGYTYETGAALPTPAKDGYSFAGWRVVGNVGSWKADTVITSIDMENYGNVNLIADWTPIAYDATFYSQGTLQTALTVEDYTVESGITLPEITRDHYSFAGWQPVASVGNWDANTVYAAGTYPGAWGTVQFNAVWNVYTYTVVWQNADGTVLETDTLVEYGTLPTYDGETPVKAADAQFTYTFVGWTPAVEPVAGANGTTYTYTATFASTVNAYTVTWQYETDESGTMVTVTDTFRYGEMPAFKDGIPVKQSSNEADHVWQFMGWYPEVNIVTGNVTYTAIFVKNEDPVTVTWMIDGVAHKTYDVAGSIPAYPTTPVKADNGGYRFTFAGWAATENGTILDTLPELGTENVTYYAVFTSAPITYTATLVGNGGTVENDTETYAAEDDALELPIPERNGYTFTGWKPLASVGNWDANSLYNAGVLGGMLGDVTLVAQWTATEYTVTVYPANGEAEYALTYTIDGTQTLPNVSREGYTFTGWYILLGDGSWKQGQVLDLNESLTNAYGNLTVQAQWQVNRYTVTWIIDGTSATETYTYGAAIAQRTVPEKLGYIAAWDVATLPQYMPAENLTITAVYTLREYTVTYNANGGEMPATYPTVYNITSTEALPVPTKEGSLFAGWQVVSEGGNWILNTTTAASATLAGRYGNVALKAVWTPTIHEIKWIIDGKERIAHWYYGAMPSYDGIPVKPNDAQYTYTFTGWDKEIVTVTGDAVYTAQFDKKIRTYPVTWMLEDKVLEVKEYAYGEIPDFSGADPIKPSNNLYAYTFSGWTPERVAVEGPQTYYAQFTVYRFVQSVVLNYSDITLVNGSTLQLTASVYPIDADDPSVEWISLDKSIATVDVNGLVTAVGVGTTSICVRSLENPELVAFCTIRVTPIYVTWLEIVASSTTTLPVGQTVQLDYILRPDNATDPGVNWVSMDAKVAIVGKTGLVTIVGEGTTTIYCYSADGYCTASISVTGLADVTPDEEEEENYVLVWFPVSQAAGGYIIDGKTFEENTFKVPYGSDIRFQLVNNKGYTVKVNGSGAYYPDEEGYYTVHNITEDISILVFTSGDNALDDEITNDPDAGKSFFERLGDFFRRIVLWFRSLFGMN